MPDSDVSSMIHVTSKIAPVEYYRFLGDAGSVTLTGFFVTRDGRQTGNSITLTVPLGNGTNDSITLGTIPTDACGFVGNSSAGLRFQICATNDASLIADFKANYARYPLLVATNTLSIGSVAVV